MGKPFGLIRVNAPCFYELYCDFQPFSKKIQDSFGVLLSSYHFQVNFLGELMQAQVTSLPVE
jgi:hypothetical protein